MKEQKHDMYFGSWYNLERGSGVYAIVNSLDNKKYIGSTGDLRKRFRQHYAALVKGDHANIHLQRAVDKYGIDKFYFIVLERCENIQETLLLIEQKYIDELGDYNICSIARKTTGIKGKGHPLSESQRNNIIAANKNRVYTEQMRKEISERVNKYQCIIDKKKPMLQFDLEGNLVNEFESVMEAQRYLKRKYNINNGRVGIKRCAQGRQHTAYGYMWKFKEENKDD